MELTLIFRFIQVRLEQICLLRSWLYLNDLSNILTMCKNTMQMNSIFGLIKIKIGNTRQMKNNIVLYLYLILIILFDIVL